MILLKRAYEEKSSSDGHRVLVDRIWPRGRTKADASIDEWIKDIAPSSPLRQSFHGRQMGWDEFRRSYLSELREHRERLRGLAKRSQTGTITLVFAAKDIQHNNAVVLAQYLKMLGGR